MTLTLKHSRLSTKLCFVHIWNMQIKSGTQRKEYRVAIESDQRCAMRYLKALIEMYHERLRMLVIPTLGCRRQWGRMIEVYKVLNYIYDPTASQSNSQKLVVQKTGPETIIRCSSSSLEAFKCNLDLVWRNRKFDIKRVSWWICTNTYELVARQLPGTRIPELNCTFLMWILKLD